MSTRNTDAMELRLFMEDLCCDLCRFRHLEEGIPGEQIRIRQDVDLNAPGAFGDIEVSIPGARPYFVEVKWTLPCEEVVERLAYKYGALTPATEKADRIVIAANGPGSGELAAALQGKIHPSLAVEVWNAARMRDLLHRHFQIQVVQFEREDLIRLRRAIERTKGLFAFGEQYTGSPFEAMLMWHFGCWTVQRVRRQQNLAGEALFREGSYSDVAIIIADLSGFSSYVRDTRDNSVVQQVLTSFYTKSRRAVINHGGMMSQFVGDSVIGAFGVPAAWPGYLDDALKCAASIMDIGKSVSNKWQRYIDRIQSAAGCHTGMALGDLLVVPLRAYSRSHLGIVADAVNMAARLASAAGPGEIVVSNALYQGLGKACRETFTQMDPIEAKNVGKLQAWKWTLGCEHPNPE